MVHSFTVFYQRRWIHSFHGACKCLIIGRTIQRLLVRHTLITQTHTHAVSGWPLLPLAPTTRRYSDLFLVQFLRFFFLSRRCCCCLCRSIVTRAHTRPSSIWIQVFVSRYQCFALRGWWISVLFHAKCKVFIIHSRLNGSKINHVLLYIDITINLRVQLNRRQSLDRSGVASSDAASIFRIWRLWVAFFLLRFQTNVGSVHLQS